MEPVAEPMTMAESMEPFMALFRSVAPRAATTQDWTRDAQTEFSPLLQVLREGNRQTGPRREPPMTYMAPVKSAVANTDYPLLADMPSNFSAKFSGVDFILPEKSVSCEKAEAQAAFRASQEAEWVQRLLLSPSPKTKQYTTVIVRNYPGPFGHSHILKQWPVNGTFDYLEVPFKAADTCFKGYVVINFLDHEAAKAFTTYWDGRSIQRNQQAVLEVRPFHVQGTKALLDRFRGKDFRKLSRHGHLPLLFDGASRLNTKGVLASLFQ